MRPSLAITYSHVRENGLLGMGFEVAGFSAITRCPKTIVQDGANGGVMLDATDVYCLDGARLRLEAGTYGATGSTYRTEIESFSKVTANGTAGFGPAWFEVRKRDGLIYEYGATTDSRVDFGGGTPRAWALNAIRDRANNRVEFIYIEDAANGSLRPSAVNYATNTAAGVTVAPYQILFVYEAANRPDPIVGYSPIGGAANEYKRLQQIEVRYSGSPVKIYKLNYEPAGGAGSRSRLASLQECSTSTSDCLAATQFTWTNGVAAFQAEQNPSQTGYPYLMDVDGDGRDDLVYTSSTTAGAGTWRIRKANASGTFDAEINTGISNAGQQGAMPLEWDGDGMADLLVPYASNQWYVLRSTGSGFATPFNTGIAVAGRQIAADFNGDGRDDLVRMTLTGAASLYVRYREVSNFGTESLLWSTWDANFKFSSFFIDDLYNNRNHIRKPDFDGDTNRDFLCWMEYFDFESKQTAEYVARCFAAGFEIFAESIGGSTELGGSHTYGDFNDDGLTDVFWTYSSGASAVLYGGSYTPVAGPNTGGALFTSLDYDGDGRDDILAQVGGAPLRLYRSNGSGFDAYINTPYTYPVGTPLRVGDLNGDLYSDLISSGSTLKYRLHEPAPADLLASATDGFGVSAVFTYAQMTDATVYTKGTGAIYPQVDFKGGRPLVRQVTATDGTGFDTTYTLNYTYEAARRDFHGRGFLGFAKRTEVDSRLGYNLKTEEFYLRDWPYTGMPSSLTVKQSNGNIISDTTNLWNVLTYDAGNRQRKYPYIYSSATQQRELDNVAFSTTTRVLAGALGTSGIDPVSGLITDVTTTTTENGSTGLFSTDYKTERTVNTVFNDTANWCIARPDTSSRENDLSLSEVDPKTRVLDRTWDGLYCRLTSQVIEPSQPAWSVTTSYLYDAFGNVSSETVTGAGMAGRTTGISWGTPGRFPVTITNPLLQVATFGYDYALGLRTSTQDADGVQTSWSYDAFGRLTIETRPASSTLFELTSTGGWDIPRAKYFSNMTLRAADGITVLHTSGASHDRFDRGYYTFSQKPSGSTYSWWARWFGFDAAGRMNLSYTPWDGASPSGCWRVERDALDRVLAQRLYGGCTGSSVQSQTYAYNGLASTTTNFRGYQTTDYRTAWGDVARVTDAAGGNTNYSYDGFGQLTQIKDAFNTITTSIGYNVRGMKTSATDVDSGAWTYVPNALGELVSQTSANELPATTFTYDLLGRPKKRMEPEGDTDWTWDSYAGNTRVGYLMRVTSPGYAEQLSYDTQSRVTQRKITVDAIDHFVNYAYNTNSGYLDTLEYPTSTAGYRFKLKYSYGYGSLTKISRSDAPNTEYWKLNQLDARGNSLDVVLGNSTQIQSTFDPLVGTLETRTSGPGASLQNLEYDWDVNGNLTRRKDARQNLTETFAYDSLDRLTGVSGPTNQTVYYDLIGNITSKSDVGGYTYHANKKHAVITAGGNSYGYDANGNMTSRGGNSISWYSYDLPATINGSGGVSSQFFYGPDRARYKQIGNYSGGTETTLYIGGVLEKLTTSSHAHFRHQISSPDGLVATYIRRDDLTEHTSYFTKDHLGSVNSISNDSGTTYLSYDAFGKRRNAATWSGAPPFADMTNVANYSRRGFTEHETLDNLGLIHMNGRVQDPLLGRFISADPFVSDPYNGQTLNRYSYVNNNPLSFTDPSGFVPRREDCDCNPSVPTSSNDDAFWLSFLSAVHLSFAGPPGAQNRISPEVTSVNGEMSAYDKQTKSIDGPNTQDGLCEIGIAGCTERRRETQQLDLYAKGHYWCSDDSQACRENNAILREQCERNFSCGNVENVYPETWLLSGSALRMMRAVPSKAKELSFERKLDFLFNKNINQSNKYNAKRAAANHQRIGIADTPGNRAEVTRRFNEAYRDPSTIVGPGATPGSNMREFFLPGITSRGSIIQFVELDGKVITIIAK